MKDKENNRKVLIEVDKGKALGSFADVVSDMMTGELTDAGKEGLNEISLMMKQISTS